MNKRGLEFKRGIMSIIAFSAVMLAISVLITSWNGKYNSGLDNDLDEFSKLDSITSDVQSQSIRLTPNDPDPGTDAEANTFRGGYGILTNIFNSFDPVIGEDSIVDEATERFGIPSYVKQIFLGLVVTALVFSLIGVVFRLGKAA